MTNSTDDVLSQTLHESETTIIYRGYSRSQRIPVVVKSLRSKHPKHSEIARLKHELAIARRLSLPGVVKILGIDKIGENLSLIMEDTGGIALNLRSNARPLDVKEALHVALSITDTLGAIHRAGVIHMDIKPHNIIVDPVTLDAKIIDFGSATYLSQDVQPPGRARSFQGTPAYMSPEQSGRMNLAVDLRADLYSLGVTIYELLTGVLPFLATDPLELMHSHIARLPSPPKEIAPDVPKLLSDIVMVLLAKSPEDRYQSAYGLKADLEDCRLQLEATGTIEPFPLGRYDRTDDLRIALKLYGREAERTILMEAWERASKGEGELVLLAGYSGVGKSALAYEVCNAVARSGGHFAAGKFDQLNRTTPYAAIAAAFREIIRTLLTEPDEALVAWKKKLQRALGANGKLIVDLIPELELILGPQPAIPPLSPSESQNRFNLVFESFCRAFATRERPLALFLDDLQWADPASLKLLQLLISARDIGHTLIIGAYRDNEVDETHAFSLVISAIKESGAAVHEIALGPLDVKSVKELLADALDVELQRAEPLASLIFTKTQGNPFFMGQFLKTLRSERLISFDRDARAWTWDLGRIEEMRITDNVVDFMATKLRSLPESTQRVLELAACIGHQFDLKTLSVIRDASPREVVREIWDALRQGFVVSLDADSRFLYADLDEAEGEGDDTINASYRFLHDRVQQAAYSLIEESSKQEVHLRIGRLWLARATLEDLEDEIFDIVGHMNMGVALIKGPEERLGLARLNLRAGKKAKAGLAYEAASSYLRIGVAQLSAGWEEDYALGFALHAALAECESLLGHFEAAEALFDLLATRALTNLDRVEVCVARIAFYATLGKFSEVISTGIAGLALLGIEIPVGTPARSAMLEAEMRAFEAELGGREIADLVNLPVVTDPEICAAQRLLGDLISPASADSVAAMLFIAIQMNLSLRHGNSDASACGYIMNAMTLAADGKSYRESYAFAKLATGVNEKFNDMRLAGMLIFGVATTLHFFEPIRAVLDSLARCRQTGLEVGDLTSASYSCIHIISDSLILGDDLESLDKQNNQFLDLMKRTKNLLTTIILVGAKQIIANLAGRTADRDSLSDAAFDERAYEADISKPEFTYIAAWYYLFRTELAYLYGNHAAALSHLRRAEETMSPRWACIYWTSELPFFACLTHAALCIGGAAAEHLAALTAHEATIANLASICPQNYEHRHLLVRAEIARIAGRELEAISLYDQSIERARANGFARDEAIANEVSGRFHLARGRRKCARSYLTDAYHGYLKWGATAKTEDMRAAMPEIFAALTPASGTWVDQKQSITTISSTNSTSTLGTNILDVDAVIRSAQALAGEIVLENLLKSLMDIVIKNAGAQKGVLVLDRGGQLVVEASITVDPHLVCVGRATPLETSEDLPLSVVQYVARTKEHVLLGDVSHEARFKTDPYIVAHAPKSILCLTMANQGRVSGILYLENSVANNAFTPARFELLNLILAQAATAVANAILYEHLERRTGELRDAEQRLQIEFAERERSEAARMALQDEIIRVQNARLAELSTPLIPITDRIMVMPLIGMMDAARAQQVLNIALQGVQTNRAEVVILDITGVKLVDSEVASTLISTSSALRLLGAQAVITGIRPEVAQTLVSLQVRFGAIVTKGTLQSGIAYALERTGGGPGRF
jgi:predicted ATPase/GAF domain-containing protein/anti-anti-sigma regulatory factor/tRNA A-37 threonylcarbamoyl transferase component Bud32